MKFRKSTPETDPRYTEIHDDKFVKEHKGDGGVVWTEYNGQTAVIADDRLYLYDKNIGVSPTCQWNDERQAVPHTGPIQHVYTSRKDAERMHREFFYGRDVDAERAAQIEAHERELQRRSS